MKIIKRIFLTIFVLTAVGILFLGWFYRYFVTYKSIGLRTNYHVTDEKLKTYLEASFDEQADPDIEQIIDLALSLTSKKLHFTAENNDTDPNKLIESKTAHCVGYAAFFATSCNYLFQKYNFSDQWVAKPQIGQLHLLGTNIHEYFNSAFLEDHDFVTIENKTTGEIYAVDPTVNDYFCIGLITFIK